ncbi:MAG: hypothetical protein WA634_06790, partial [Silvibacterium sp.]
IFARHRRASIKQQVPPTARADRLEVTQECSNSVERRLLPGREVTVVPSEVDPGNPSTPRAIPDRDAELNQENVASI